MAFVPIECHGQYIFDKVKSLVKKDQPKQAKVADEDIYDLTLEQNLNNPKVGKEVERICEYQKKKKKNLEKMGYPVTLMRNNEVVKVVLSSNNLFNPSDTVLTKRGELVLKPFLKELETADFYRMILVMYSDDTGTASYNNKLTRARVENIFEWFMNQKATKPEISTDFILPYFLGNNDPIYPNNSMDNRERNRRLEILLVPGKAMIELSKKKEL